VDFRKIAGKSDEVRNAFEFKFAPLPDVDYAWVIKHAKEQFAAADSAFKTADEKAVSIMNYLGSGAGLFTIGSIAGLAANQLNPFVALAGIPSLLLAGLSLVFASLARRPYSAAYQPTAMQASERANLYDLHGGTAIEAEASLVSTWHQATTLCQDATNRKAGWVSSATWMFVVSVSLLLLPLATAIGQKLFFPKNADDPKPMQVIIKNPAGPPIPAATP